MDLTLMAANQVGVNIIRNITDAEVASIEAQGEIERSKMRMAHFEEMQKLKAEHEQLVAEGEAIAAQGERNRTHKKLRAYYKERHQNYPVEKQRMYHTFLMKTKLKDKIENMLSGYIIRKSSNETYDNIFSNYPKNQPITTTLLENKKAPKEA